MNVVDFLMKTCGFSSSFSEAEVHRAIGIIRTNCIHVQPQYLKNQVNNSESGGASINDVVREGGV